MNKECTLPEDPEKNKKGEAEEKNNLLDVFADRLIDIFIQQIQSQKEFFKKK